MNADLVISPTPRNKNAVVAFFLLLGVAALFFGASYLRQSFRGVIQLFALIFFVGAIMIYTKYLSCRYSYEVTTDTADTPVFVVRSRTGRRSSTLCRIDLWDITALTRQDPTAMKAYKAPVGVRKYVYTPTLFPPDRVLIVVEGGTEHAHILIEAPEEYIRYLSDRVAQAKALRLAEE